MHAFLFSKHVLVFSCYFFFLHDKLKNYRNKELKYLERKRRAIRRRLRRDESRDTRFKLGLSKRVGDWRVIGVTTSSSGLRAPAADPVGARRDHGAMRMREWARPHRRQDRDAFSPAKAAID